MGSLGLIFASFLSAFKSGAADPVAAATAARAVERLDKMSLVRQQLQRQLNAIMSTYAPFDQRIGQVLGEAYEQRELLALYRLQARARRGSVSAIARVSLPRRGCAAGMAVRIARKRTARRRHPWRRWRSRWSGRWTREKAPRWYLAPCAAGKHQDPQEWHLQV